jgi:hypothetical protein
MTRPTIQISSEIREMNEIEHAQYLIDQATDAIFVAEIDATFTATAAAKKSAIAKLAALGLTADEISAL